MSNIPKLRFPEFTDAWEKWELGKIADIFDNQRVPVAANERITGTIPYYGSNGIQDYVDGFTHQGEFVLLAEDGANDTKNYPCEYVEGKIWVNNHAHVLSGKKNLLNNLFLTSRIKSMDISPYLVGGGRAKLNAKVMLKIELSIPTLPEQQKIGNLFKQLDRLITLHKRKWDDVILLKKALLQKMFPKNGSDFPEIRFPEFTDAWEKCKLGEVAKYRNGKAHEQNISTNGQYIVVNSKFISSNGYVKKYSEYQIEPLYKNDITFVLSDVPNGKALAKTFLIESDNLYTLNQRVAAFSTLKNNDSYFLNIILDRNNYFLSFDSGVGQTNLSISDVMGFNFHIPTLPEQQKIGNLFKQLDRLITLHK